MSLEDDATAAGASLRAATAGIVPPQIGAVSTNRRLRSGAAVLLLASVGTAAVAASLWPAPTGTQVSVSAASSVAPSSSTAPPPATSAPAASTGPTTTSTTTPIAVPGEGPLFGEPIGELLIFDDGIDGILALDPDHRIGSRSVIDGQRAGDAPYRLVRVGGHLVVGWGRIFSVELASRDSTEIGEATIFVPAVEPDVVWLIDYPGAAIGAGTPTAWQVDMHGNQITEPRSLDSDGMQAIGIEGGLAIEGTNGIALWDAAAAAITRHLGTSAGSISDAAGSLLAWCEMDCTELHITDVATEVDIVIPSPADGDVSRRRPFGGRSERFSPDGQQLAAPSGTSLLLIDTATGEARTVAELPGDEGPWFVTWSPDGDELFASSSSYGRSTTTVVRYDLDTEATAVATLPFGGALTLIVTDHDEAAGFISDQDQLPSDCPSVNVYPSGRTGICGFRY